MHLVNLRLRVVAQHAGVWVVGARLAEQVHGFVVEFHVQPDAAAFGIAGRQLVAAFVGDGDLELSIGVSDRQRCGIG